MSEKRVCRKSSCTSIFYFFRSGNIGKLDESREYRDLLFADQRFIAPGYQDPVRVELPKDVRGKVWIGVGFANMTLASIVQLGGVLTDMEKTSMMMSRYPWKPGKITRAEHLELTWFLYQNLCYKFKEKLKLAFNSQKKLSHFLGMGAPTWLKSELKSIDQSLGREIQARGNTVHDWNVGQDDIDRLGMIENLTAAKDAGEVVDLPQGFFDVVGHYRDVKWQVKSEATEMNKKAHEILSRVLKNHEPLPIRQLRKASESLGPFLIPIEEFRKQ